MPKTVLTELTVRSTQPPPVGQTTVWDTLPGFGLRVSQGGAKTFVVLLGHGRRHTIGRYPIISLAQARTEAKRVLAERTLGNHRNKSIKFSEAHDLFLSTHCSPENLKFRTIKDYERMLKKYLLPAFRHDSLEEITTQAISKIIDRLRPTPSEANHLFAVARTFFRWAVKRRYIPHNPCEGMSLPSVRPTRDRVLNDAELVSLFRAADNVGYPFGTIIQLLVLTGQRRGEIAALRWQYIDEKQQTITLPASITKNTRQHTFPYGKRAARIFSQLSRNGDYLFPARGNSGNVFSGWSKCKMGIDDTLSIAPWTLHDLRRTFATNLAALNVPPFVVERLLNHSSGTISGVAAIYNRHAYMDEMRDAISKWEDRLASLLLTH